MKRVLFQGDSITDCGRSREDESNKGRGYATLVISRLGYDEPGVYEFFNRGIASEKVTDIYRRIKEDIIDLKPDYLSILVGVNDAWYYLKEENGVSCEEYEQVYDRLIREVTEALPHIKIMILESFVTPGKQTKDDWEALRAEVEKRGAVAKRIAEKYNLTFVPLQAKFDAMIEKQPEPYWTWEGVHPTEPGHELIAREWMKAFKTL